MKTYYIDTDNTVYVFSLNPELIDREKIARKLRKKVLVLDLESFKEMRILLLPDILKVGTINGEAELAV